jgi:hypothetical protein
MLKTDAAPSSAHPEREFRKSLQKGRIDARYFLPDR